jgi:hypothetical protein
VLNNNEAFEFFILRNTSPVTELEDLRLEESGILTLMSSAHGELFERLTHELFSVLGKIFALNHPSPVVEKTSPEAWDAMTRLQAQMD